MPIGALGTRRRRRRRRKVWMRLGGGELNVQRTCSEAQGGN